MPRVSAADLRHVARFLATAHEVGGADAAGMLRRPVLHALAQLIPVDLVECFELRRADRSVIAHTTGWDVPPPPREVTRRYPRIKSENPLGAFKWAPANGPVMLSRVVPRRELMRSAWYDGYLRPLGIRDQLKIWLDSTSASVACISLERTDREFSDRDAALLEVVRLHLAGMRAAALSGRTGPEGTSSSFTLREAQVLSWAIGGRTNREISALLVVSEATVRKHLERAYAKLGVRTRAQAGAVVTGFRRPDHPA